MQITTIGLDLAKSIFQVHGIDASGQVVVRKKLRRAEVLKFFWTLGPCLVGIEACATAHHWARQLGALGHDVRLMSPAYAKAYVRRQKNDAADAEAICEAVQRPTMRFVPVKSAERQSVLCCTDARASGAPADHADQRHPRPLRRVRDHRTTGRAPAAELIEGIRRGEIGDIAARPN
jgi:transposase